MSKFTIAIADERHLKYIPQIEAAITEAAKVKGTGLAKRSSEYLEDKIRQGKAVIALDGEGIFAGFCYIESWGHEQFVANSGLIVPEQFRGKGLALKIKSEAFKLSRKLFPTARMFGLTTSLAVMKINSALGYKPVTFSELTVEDDFWKGCQTCAYYDILFRTNRSLCLCTGMLYDPKKDEKKKGIIKGFRRNGKSKTKQLKKSTNDEKSSTSI